MVHRLTERQQAIVFAVVLAVSLAAVYGAIKISEPPAVTPKGLIRAGLVVEGDGWTIEYVDVATGNNTAFGILLEAADRLGFDVDWVQYSIPPGVFVTAINGTVNGQGNRWWQYWVSGDYGNVAADRKEIFDGDLVEWTFLVSMEAAP